MAVAWTDITNAQVASGAALTTALATAWRDNPEGIAQRASGAPKIFGVAYDFQEFTTNGTWTKPSNAETGDKVVVHVVGGGGSGGKNTSGGGTGGGGGGGAYRTFDVDALGASEAVVVGAGGAAVSGSSSDGNGGGASSFGTSGNQEYTHAFGGGRGLSKTTGDKEGGSGGAARTFDADTPDGTTAKYSAWGGDGGDVRSDGTLKDGGASVFGGGGGGGTSNSSVEEGVGGISHYAGSGGRATSDATQPEDGEFPGGGGGGTEDGATSGAGGDGVVWVWCIKEG